MRSVRLSFAWTKLPGKHRRPGNRLGLEPLESRCLLSTMSVAEYPALSNGTNGNPTQLAVGSDGNLWFTEPGSDQVGTFSPTGHTVSSQVYTTATEGDPTGIAATTGTSASLWFTLNAVGQIGKVVPGLSTAQVLSESGNYHSSAGITTANGDIWVTLPGANEVLDYNPATGAVVNDSLSPANINISGFNSQIAAGADGNLWFTEPGAIGIFNPRTDKVIGQVSLPMVAGTQMPESIAIGPDGNMWFTESTSTSSAVGVINTATEQYVTEFALSGSAKPDGITAGPDNNVWFTESGSGAIGEIVVNSMSDPTLDTLGTSIAIPVSGQTGGVVSSPDPLGITAGPDGNLWFADRSGAIGVVTLNASPHFGLSSAPISSITAGTDFGLTISDEYSPTVPVQSFEGSVTATVYDSADEVVGTAETVTAVDGVATFAGLAVDLAGTGYTIKVTSSADNAPSSLTTSSFSVVAASPSKLVLSALPGTVTAGSGFGLTVELEDQFNNVATNYTGTVNVALANNPGGSVLGGTTSVIVSPGSATPGYASFTNLTLTKAAAGYTLKVLATGVPAQTTGGISVASSSASQLVVTSPPASALTPGAAFALTVAVEDRYGNLARTYNGTVSVALASNPGGGSLSGTTSEGVSSSGSAPGYATFSGLSLANPGNGYTLLISATGLASTTYGTINVLAPPPPTPPSITSVSVIFTQKTNKKGKKIGKPVISGYVITFSTAMNQGSLVSTGSYVVDTVVTTKRTRKKPAQTILTPIGFSVKAVTDNSVTLSPSGTPFAKKAGLITVIAAGSGVESSAGATLASSAVFSIAKGGKSI
jgi:streptogramin lyase